MTYKGEALKGQQVEMNATKEKALHLKNLNVHTATNARAAYDANLAEAQRLSAALLAKLMTMAADKSPKHYGDAGSMAELRISLESLDP